MPRLAHFSNSKTQQLSVGGDIVVNGDIVLPNLTLSDDGIYLTQGLLMLEAASSALRRMAP